MKNNHHFTCQHLAFAVVGAATLAFSTGVSSAQIVTNAFDVASSYVASGFTGNQGFGFGAWTVSTTGGGKYIANDATSHPRSFGLWNNTANSSSTAVRTFNTSLTSGQSFLFQFQLVNLDNSSNRNGVSLQDSSGNTLFSFYHQGGDNANGWYNDANVTAGVATGFTYNFQNFSDYTFTLTSATTYTFTDNTTATSISGDLAGTISQVMFYRSNLGSAPSNGQDFKFDSLAITSVPEPTTLALAGLGCSLLLIVRRRLN